MSGKMLLKVHGVVEALAGIAMIVAPLKMFPIISDQCVEIQFLVKFFGTAILALGITGFLAKPSSGVLFGALSYHSTITGMFIRLLLVNGLSDPQKGYSAVFVHGLFTILFAYSWINCVSNKRKNKQN